MQEDWFEIKHFFRQGVTLKKKLPTFTEGTIASEKKAQTYQTLFFVFNSKTT